MSNADNAARDIKVAPLHPWQTRERSRRRDEQQLHLETIQTMRDLLSWNKRHTRLWKAQTARKSVQSEHERPSGLNESLAAFSKDAAAADELQAARGLRDRIEEGKCEK